MQTASWVIKELSTGRVICETFSRSVVAALNVERYEAVPILQHLVGLTQRDVKPLAGRAAIEG